MADQMARPLKLKNNYPLEQMYKAKDSSAIKLFSDRSLFYEAIICSTISTDLVTDILSLCLTVTKLSQDDHPVSWAHGHGIRLTS